VQQSPASLQPFAVQSIVQQPVLLGLHPNDGQLAAVVHSHFAGSASHPNKHLRPVPGVQQVDPSFLHPVVAHPVAQHAVPLGLHALSVQSVALQSHFVASAPHPKVHASVQHVPALLQPLVVQSALQQPDLSGLHPFAGQLVAATQVQVVAFEQPKAHVAVQHV